MRAPLAGLLILAACLTAPAAQAFRCGTELVQKGDRKFDVIEKCGEPDFRESHAGGYLPGVGPVNVTEIWYYDQGPCRAYTDFPPRASARHRDGQPRLQ